MQEIFVPIFMLGCAFGYLVAMAAKSAASNTIADIPQMSLPRRIVHPPVPYDAVELGEGKQLVFNAEGGFKVIDIQPKETSEPCSPSNR